MASRIESSLESGSRSEETVTASSSSSPIISSRSESQLAREASPANELAARIREQGASSQNYGSDEPNRDTRESDADAQIAEGDEEQGKEKGDGDDGDGDDVEVEGEEEGDEGGGEEEEEEDAEGRTRRKGSKRKGNIENRLLRIESQMTPERLAEMRALHRFSPGVILRSPGPGDRPWQAPEGWVALYEAWFSQCHLWVPLPRLLTDYVDRRGVAFTQLLPAGIWFMIAALVFGIEVGVNFDWRFFEEMTLVQKNNSIHDQNINFGAFPDNYWTDVAKLQSFGIQHWPEVHSQRVRAAITRIRLGEELITIPEKQLRWPVQVNAPNLAARLRGRKKKSSVVSQGASASRSESQATAPRLEGNILQREEELAPQHEELAPLPEGGILPDSGVIHEGESGGQTENLDQVETRVEVQQETQQTDDVTAEAVRSAARSMKRGKKKEKKKKNDVGASRLAEQEVGVEAPRSQDRKKKHVAAEANVGEEVTRGEVSKRTKVSPTGAELTQEIDWSFQFDYDNRDEPFVNNKDKCAMLFGMIRGSTSGVPAGEDAVFKDMTS
ncbi:meiosis-specific protein ASY2-like [Eutrema salsugineum]|uniref:meiosis-specific protein ASY2-like n=1 Tax=Eutrema salsugineum TaxID=72664 RepID=UPI000CED4D72|nr:meiosis-specific protein ASY2-like [Eutrema salsugineum]